MESQSNYPKRGGLPGKTVSPRLKEIEDNFVKNGGSFKEFRIGDLFYKLDLKFRKNKFDKKKDVSTVRNHEFCLPLVNAKNGDNGIMYYGRSEDWDSEELCIDIVNDGAVSTGNAYPQPQRTSVLYNAYLIKGIEKSFHNELAIIYASQVLQKSIKGRYGYDNKATWEKVKNDFISLPITSDNHIAFDTMETFIRTVEKLCVRSVVQWKDKIIETIKRIVNENALSDA